jgi:ribose transport system permease protein
MMIKSIKISPELKQTLSIVIVFLTLFIIAGTLRPRFWTIEHLNFFLWDLSLLGILAIAQTIVILSGGIDLSTGAIYFFASGICGALTAITHDFFIPVIIALLLGVLLGAINGIGVAKLKIPPIIMTLGMLIFLSGLAFIIIGPAPSGGAHPLLITISKGSTYIWFAIVILFIIISERTKFGWQVRYIGSNPTASYVSGINVKKVTLLVYIISGLLSALAGLFYLGWARTPYIAFTVSAMGVDSTIRSIAAVLIGGTLFLGGLGGFDRSFIGTLITGTLFALIRMFGLGQEAILIVEGILLIAIVYVYLRVYHRRTA